MQGYHIRGRRDLATPRNFGRLRRSVYVGDGSGARIGAVRNISALPQRADVGEGIVEPSVSARSGCEQPQQSALHILLT